MGSRVNVPSIDSEAPRESSTKVRLYMAEYRDADNDNAPFESLLSTPADFAMHHKTEHIRGVPGPTFPGTNCFYFKWLRPLEQKPELWEIEQRIEKGKPYSIDTFVDPAELSLDHKRYERKYPTHRPYGPIRKLPDSIVHSAIECVALFGRQDATGFTGNEL